MPIDPALKAQWEAQFGSGIRSECDFTILMASFTYDARYGDGQMLVLRLAGLDENEEEYEELLSIGADWETLDGGQTIINQKRPRAIVNKNTNYGRWCAFAAIACDIIDNDWIYHQDAKDARVWVGTKWRLKEKKVGEGFTNKTGDVVEARYRLMPDEFLGAENTPSAASGPVSIPEPSPTRTAPSPAIPAPPPNGSSGVTLATQLAATSPDYASFINSALAIDAISIDDNLVPQLLDSSSSGFYATHHSG